VHNADVARRDKRLIVRIGLESRFMSDVRKNGATPGP